MKKSLLAVAAMGAFASAAQAQSSVTVYGILDAGFVGASNRVQSSSITTNGGNSKGTYNSFTTGAETSPRLGFKGTEDLGGGMSAFFTAEFQLYQADGTLSGNTNQGLLNRQAFVGLKKKGIGQGSVGNQYTPVFTSSAATNPGQHNNVVGDVIYPSATGGGALATYDNGTVTTSFTNKVANSLVLNSDKFAGFGVNAIYTLNNKTVSQTGSATGGEANASGWGLSVDYTWNKLFATAAYQSFKQFSTGGTTNAAWGNPQASGATAVPASATAAANAQNVQDNQFLAGATYDFGILKAYAQYVNRKATATDNSAQYFSRSAQQIGVRSFITPKIEGWASAGNGRYRTFGATEPTANFNGWQLGSNYWLSKRTNLYAIYGQSLFSQAATSSATGNAASSNYALGVRHTF